MNDINFCKHMEMCIWFAYQSVHIRLTAVSKEIVTVSPVVFLSLTFGNIISKARRKNEI